jgi:predicted type IV restriction endonuclease
LKDEIANIILDVRSNRDLRVVDEASIKAGVVLHLLHGLGWDPFNVSEVTPEYSVGGRRVDFSLRAANTNKVFIEVKRPTEDLERHQEQLLSYSFSEGVKLAVLTNGMTWWLYLPLSEGNWEQRRFYSIELLEQNPDDVAGRFGDFLAKARVISGEAVKAAELLYRSKQKKSVLQDAIPKAWAKLINDPDDLLVELLIETTEKICGFRPDIADVEPFLQRLTKIVPTAFTAGSTLSLDQRQTFVDQTTGSRIWAEHRNDANFIGKKVVSFNLFGKPYYPKTWQELLLTVANEIYHRHSQDFHKCLSLRGSKMSYFSTDPGELRSPKQIASSSYYIEAHLNSNSIVQRSWDLLGLFGHSYNELQVMTR